MDYFRPHTNGCQRVVSNGPMASQRPAVPTVVVCCGFIASATFSGLNECQRLNPYRHGLYTDVGTRVVWGYHLLFNSSISVLCAVNVRSVVHHIISLT